MRRSTSQPAKIARIGASPRHQGIDAPATVAEGSPGAINGSAPGATSVLVRNLRTGDEVRVTVDSSGKFRFELPSTALSGDVLVVVNANDFAQSTSIEVTPASKVN